MSLQTPAEPPFFLISATTAPHEPSGGAPASWQFAPVAVEDELDDDEHATPNTVARETANIAMPKPTNRRGAWFIERTVARGTSSVA